MKSRSGQAGGRRSGTHAFEGGRGGFRVGKMPFRKSSPRLAKPLHAMRLADLELSFVGEGALREPRGLPLPTGLSRYGTSGQASVHSTRISKGLVESPQRRCRRLRADGHVFPAIKTHARCGRIPAFLGLFQPSDFSTVVSADFPQHRDTCGAPCYF